MKITGKMQVDIFHGHNLSITAACCTAFNSENGTQRGLSEGYYGLFTDQAQTVSQTHGSSGLTFSCGRRRYGSHQYELAVLLWTFTQVIQRDLSFIFTVIFHILIRDMQLFGDLIYGTHRSGLCYFDIGHHGG